MVSISEERYEQLLDVETRTAVLVDMLREEVYLRRENMFLILGYPDDYAKIMNERELRRDKKECAASKF